MTGSFLAIVRVLLTLSCLLPGLLTLCSRLREGEWQAGSIADVVLWLLAGTAASAVAWVLVGRLQPALDLTWAGDAHAVDSFPPARVPLAIAASAALGLLVELALIRWQAGVFEFFALYKNISLLSCFAGLGLGYALSGRDRVLASSAPVLVAWQLFLLIGVRYGLAPWRITSLLATPFREQTNMGFGTAREWPQLVAIYTFLALTFALTALAVMPLGQLCGRLMTRMVPLRAYGLNLFGSLLGVIIMALGSALWTPPVVWFAVAFLGLLLLPPLSVRPRAIEVAAVMVSMCLLTWPVSMEFHSIWSPYQLIEHGRGERGLMLIRAAGHYYQRVHDLSAVARQADPGLARAAAHYDLPYLFKPSPHRVLVVGAGAGNDVAAALRAGAAAVDAVEIDPAILALGRLNHPERPYDDPRVTAIVDDARSFLRRTDQHYDLIVYGLLDSHSLLSHASSVRVDSFVYTIEGLRDARARLSEGGLLSLSFTVVNRTTGLKIFRMLEAAFDGNTPSAVRADYDGSVVFLQPREGVLQLPAPTLDALAVRDVTARFSDRSLEADVSTDDWPFFYMPRRVYPWSYLPVLALTAGLTLVLMRTFGERPLTSEGLPFFLLGAAFMLVETKAITELGLLFGNTWQVVAAVIAAVLTMAFLANAWVARAVPQRLWPAFLLLLISVVGGWYVSGTAAFAPTTTGRLLAGFVLTLPLFFSGIVFSTLLARSGVTQAMAANLLGAMAGGWLEYNSMYFGFRFLYWIAGGLYVFALLSALYFVRPSSAGVKTAALPE